MKRHCFNRKDALLFIEFTVVLVFLLLPPLFAGVPFILPPKPTGLYAQCIFYFNTICAAAYEEMLYRLYTPNRLHRIYIDYIIPRLQERSVESESTGYLPQPSFSHKKFRYKKLVISFDLLLTECPALLLFTLAHRYLGVASMFFAATAGIVFRIAYLKLKRVLHPAVSIAFVVAVHGFWNIGVYYYLWEHHVTV